MEQLHWIEMLNKDKRPRFQENECEIIGTATHSETLEELTIYRSLYGGGRLWARPAAAAQNETAEPVKTIEQSKLIEQSKMFGQNKSIKPLERSESSIPFASIKRSEPSVPSVPSVPIESIEPIPPAGIHNNSAPAEKIELFMSLFTGREDVFARRWENAKKDASGYVPACLSEWSALCPKSGGGKMKCGKCPNHNFVKYDADAVEKHLMGHMTVGVYPMLPDETCRFLAFDFDGKEYSPETLRHDVGAIREICAEKGIRVAAERSRSGAGIHLWFFFAENIPAGTARKFGSSLITRAMNQHHELPFKTYDRMIPAQDTLTNGGFGNLIALPLQKAPREQGRSVFVDENFNTYPDQWNYLSRVQRYTLKEIESFIRQLSPSDELGDLRRDSEDEKPWKGKKPAPKLTKSDFPDKVNIVSANGLYVDKSGISSPGLNALKRLAAFRNPEFYKAQAMRLPTHKMTRIISCSDETERYLCLPRGLEDEIRGLLETNGAAAQFRDETNPGRGIDVRFNGELRGGQQQAADALLAHNNGILSATTAFGKTVVGAYLIAERKVNTLVLVHRTNLLSQWRERLNEFLTVHEEPAPELTPTGRKRKKTVIGQIGGGKTNPSGVIDVAVMQSLVSGDEVKELVRDYGMVIVDECHHVSAVSFEQILKAVNAKYVYGLTATPARQDGHHPIIYMHCGKIRWRVDAKEQAAARPFEHFVIPRFTRFQKPAHRDGNEWTWNDIYGDIQNNELRNSLILQDVTAAAEQGRSPIILTERVGHVKYLAKQLRPNIKNVITLTGGETRKKSRETLQSVAEIPAGEPFVLVATGKYVGEGFDMPRLDTLFLAMPISWKGTLQQYAGRLHRLYDGKKEVQVYDYVDVHVETLENMYQKRLRGYASIGYKVKGTPQPLEEAHSIFDNRTFFPVYSADISAAGSE
ncbi:MAG: DUF1653 domain-containing protein, partial [Peptococcaceae bacterium]|nr:DUF1653 domain-containing protein [Peptococcaceae bacterium]